MRLLMTTTLLVLFSTTAFAACEYYAGHFDLEGKIGNTRNLGEASAFLPIACTQDRLLFTDLKFRADNLSNREANIGIGGRLQREDGIVGGYIYFDRKKSGETDKFYTQITTGAEWLADHWETRANLYIPLNGAKNVSATTTTSDPYLAGSNIFIDQAGFVTKETPMYGADAEIGFKTTENLWLYGGGFTFHGNDVPTITGARVRAKYDLTDKVSLNAEGQYDDERGRQGWLGARLSVPFGNTNAARSRMTQSPVRDIDIVTQTKQQQTFQSTTPLANPESGDAQRVIYVDNRAAANGDGSLENPYNTLADAQGELRDYDIVYVFHGDGTTTGQDQGFVINKDNVSFIGEGSPLTFAGYTLRAAGDKPVITNTELSVTQYEGNGIKVLGRDVSIAGLSFEDTQGSGIAIFADGTDIGNVTVDNVDFLRTQRRGLAVGLSNAGSMGTLRASNLSAHETAGEGFRVMASTQSRFDRVELSKAEILDSQSAGIGVFINNESDVGVIDVNNATVLNSAREGIIISAGGASADGATIERISLSDLNVRDSYYQNITLRSIQANGGSVSSLIESIDLNRIKTGYSTSSASVHVTATDYSRINHLSIDALTAIDRPAIGLYVQAARNASISNATVTNSDFTDARNNSVRLQIASDAQLDIVVSGNNRILGRPVMLDLGGGTVDMRNNWWGQDTGPNSGQVPGAALTTPWLTSDPRP